MRCTKLHHSTNLNFQNPSQEDGGNYIVRAINEVGDKDCTLALNFGKFFKTGIFGG